MKINKDRKQRKLNSLDGSLNHVVDQISQTRQMIKSLERTVKRYEESKSKIQSQIDELRQMETE
ncbi:MAG: hypothetical protein CL525_16175 [Aequorivita sp.]|nr:hypothetical protein [Aequorivita sp.]